MRSAENAAAISAPFGGLQYGADVRDLNPRNCSDCRNVVTLDGNIAMRPGSAYVNISNLFVGLVTKLQSIGFSQQKYLYAFDQQNGGGSRHMLFNESFQAYIASAPNADTPDVLAYGDKVLAVSGTAAQSRKFYKIGSDIVDARLGIEAPAAAPGLALVTGALTGTYSYRYTYYNAYSDTESGPSPAAEQSPAGQGVQITMAASSDTQVTHFRVYRRLNGTNGTWYYLRQDLISTPVVTDALGTVTVSSETELVTTAPTPPRSHVACMHQSRAWYKDETSGYFGSSVAYSEFSRPELVHARSRRKCGQDQTEYVTAMRSAFGVLWVFTNRSIWAITGYDPSSYVAQRVVSGVGCIAKESIVEHDGLLYFVGADGVYAFDGQRAISLSMPPDPGRSRIGPIGDWFSPADLEGLSGAYDPVTRSYVIAGRDRIGLRWNKQLVFCIPTQCWSRWTLGCSALAQHEASFALGGRMFLATHNPGGSAHHALAIFGTPTDSTVPLAVDYDGSVIPWHWQTPRLTLGTPRRKRFYFVRAHWSGGSASGLLVARQSVDGGGLRTLANAPQDRSNKSVLGVSGSRGVDLSLRIEGGGGTAPVAIQQLDIEADVAGRR